MLDRYIVSPSDGRANKRRQLKANYIVWVQMQLERPVWSVRLIQAKPSQAKDHQQVYGSNMDQ